LRLLMEDSRTSYVELARILGVTEAAVRKRVKRLEERGVIRRYTVEVAPRKLGYDVVAIIGLDAAPDHYIRILEYLRGRCPSFTRRAETTCS